MSNNYDNDPSVILAKDLLGKVLCFNNGKEKIKYMITVTEAYPWNDSFSYIFRQTEKKTINENSKAYRILSKRENVGKFFIYGGMLHFVSAGDEKDGIYRCGNVLVRGAIRVDGTGFREEDRRMEFGEGKPYTLCHEKLKIKNYDNALTLGTDNLTISTKEYCGNPSETTRYGLKAKDDNEQEKEDKEKSFRFFIERSKVLKETD